MANTYFQFKQFTIHQDRCAMKVTTDGCLFGAWVAGKVKNKNSKSFTCLDIGTGTGLLSLMVAQQNAAAAIDAVEIDVAAAQQAMDNITATAWQNNIRIIQGDVTTLPAPMRKEYDFIFSNPPFYENDLTSPDEIKNKAHHDAGLLLDELLAVISTVLAPAGYFYLLLPYKRMTELEAYLRKYHLKMLHTTFVRATAVHPYSRIFVEGEFSNSAAVDHTMDEIIIKDSTNNYTKEFTALLQDYYLHL